jgi:hypothetical protein
LSAEEERRFRAGGWLWDLSEQRRIWATLDAERQAHAETLRRATAKAEEYGYLIQGTMPPDAIIYGMALMHKQTTSERDEARREVERLLEDLSPGGSEFVGDPKRCAQFVRERLATNMEFVKAARLAERERDEARREVERLRVALKLIRPFTDAMTQGEIDAALEADHA